MQPGQQKISQFDEVTSTQTGDIIPLVRNGQNKRITVGNFSGVVPEGWISAAQIWSFASWNAATTIGVITVPTDATLKYSQGMKVQFTQATGGIKYGTIVAVTATTISIFFGLNFTLINQAISTPLISSLYMPFGYTGTVLTRETYQSHTTNTERWVHTISGWSWIQYAASPSVTKTNTLPLSFASRPIVLLTFGGDTASTTNLGDGGNSVEGIVIAKAHTVQVNSFIAMFHKGSGANFAGGAGFYHFQAKGAVA